MLVWINGAHGAGKTSVARRLVTLRPEMHVIDPEQIGFLLRRIWPDGTPEDFKDLPLWRQLTVATLRAASLDHPGRAILVPMTLASPELHDEIVCGLRRSGTDLRHFTLIASPATLRHRLRWRLDWPSSRRWALARLEQFAMVLESPQFADHIPTDGRSVSQVAGDLLARLGG